MVPLCFAANIITSKYKVTSNHKFDLYIVKIANLGSIIRLIFAQIKKHTE